MPVNIISKKSKSKTKPDIEWSGYSNDDNATFSSNKSDFCQIYFSIRSLSTCSTHELSEFIKEGNLSIVPKDIRIKTIRNTFLNLPNIKNKKGGVTTYIFTLIDNEPCNYIREALDGWDEFVMVKSFVNIGSGNRNDLYVSTGGAK